MILVLPKPSRTYKCTYTFIIQFERKIILELFITSKCSITFLKNHLLYFLVLMCKHKS